MSVQQQVMEGAGRYVLSIRLWRALWRDPFALEQAEQWMNIMYPPFRAERFQSFNLGDFAQLGGILFFLMLFGPLLVIGLLVLGVFSGTVRGVLAANRISHLLAEQRISRRLDALGVTPGGAFLAAWSLVVYHHHRKEGQNPLVGVALTAQSILLIACGVGLTLIALNVVLMLVGGGIEMLFQPTSQATLEWAGLLGAVILVMRHDGMVSPLTGAGMGIWGGASTSGGADVRLWTIGAFLGVRVAALLLVLTVWAGLTLVLSLSFWPALLALVLGYVVTHELVLRRVWGMACEALGIAPSDVLSGWPVPPARHVVQSNLEDY
jgi:hypothetical protein